MVQEKSFKDSSYQSSGGQQNRLCNFGREYHEEQFCEIILNLDQWFKRKCCLKDFLLFVLFDLILYVPSTIFQLTKDGSSWVEPVLS